MVIRDISWSTQLAHHTPNNVEFNVGKNGFFGPPVNHLPVVASLTNAFADLHGAGHLPPHIQSKTDAPSAGATQTDGLSARLKQQYPNLPKQYANVDVNGLHVVTGEKMTIGNPANYDEHPGITAAFNVGKKAFTDTVSMVDGWIDYYSRGLAASVLNAKGISAQPGHPNLRTVKGPDGKLRTEQIYSENTLHASNVEQALFKLADEVWNDGIITSAKRFGTHVSNQAEVSAELFARGYPVQATEVGLETGGQVLAVSGLMTTAGLLATSARLPALGRAAPGDTVPKSNVVKADFQKSQASEVTAQIQPIAVNSRWPAWGGGGVAMGGRRGPVFHTEFGVDGLPTTPRDPGLEKTNPVGFGRLGVDVVLTKPDKEPTRLEQKFEAEQAARSAVITRKETVNVVGREFLGEIQKTMDSMNYHLNKATWDASGKEDIKGNTALAIERMRNDLGNQWLEFNSNMEKRLGGKPTEAEMVKYDHEYKRKLNELIRKEWDLIGDSHQTLHKVPEKLNRDQAEKILKSMSDAQKLDLAKKLDIPVHEHHSPHINMTSYWLDPPPALISYEFTLTPEIVMEARLLGLI